MRRIRPYHGPVPDTALIPSRHVADDTRVGGPKRVVRLKWNLVVEAKNRAVAKKNLTVHNESIQHISVQMSAGNPNVNNNVAMQKYYSTCSNVPRRFLVPSEWRRLRGVRGPLRPSKYQIQTYRNEGMCGTSYCWEIRQNRLESRKETAAQPAADVVIVGAATTNNSRTNTTEKAVRSRWDLVPTDPFVHEMYVRRYQVGSLATYRY